MNHRKEIRKSVPNSHTDVCHSLVCVLLQMRFCFLWFREFPIRSENTIEAAELLSLFFFLFFLFAVVAVSLRYPFDLLCAFGDVCARV